MYVLSDFLIIYLMFMIGFDDIKSTIMLVNKIDFYDIKFKDMFTLLLP